MERKMLEKQELYNIEAEQIILGTFLLNSNYYFKITQLVQAEYFFENIHREIFKLLINSYEKDKMKDLQALSFEINNISSRYKLDKKYLTVLLNAGNGVIDVESYCKSVKDLFLKRKLQEISNSIQRNINNSKKIEEICDEAEKGLNFITREEDDKKYNFESLNEICAKRIVEIEDIVVNHNEPENIIKTDIFDYDRMFGGIIRKNLTILAARANCGKALPLDTKILTNKGWILNKDIKIGDKIIDPFGKEVSVIGVFPQGKRKCYKIEFEDRSIIADKNHLWEVFFSAWDSPRILSTKQLFKLQNQAEYREHLSIRLFNGCYGGINKNKKILFQDKKNREKFLFNLLKKGDLNTKNYTKALFIQQLAFSLGLKCFVDFNKKTKFYNLRIVKDFSNKLFIKNIKKTKPQKTQCIAVDSPQHLYVVEDYITTHNTTFALQIALNVARTKNVLFFSQEMNNSEQGDKILSNFSHINSMNLRDAQISPEDISMIKNIMQNKSNIHLYISEAYGVNSNFIKKTLQIFEKKVGKVDLIIVDHLQIMTDNTTNYNRVSELSNISMDCKNIAKEYNCGFLLLSQLSRKTEEREDPRPQLADLRESGAIEQNADTVIFLFREAYYTERKLNGLNIDNPNFEILKKQFEMQKNQADLMVQKNRSGKLGSIKLYFNPEYSQFTDMTGHQLAENYNYIQK